VGSLYGKSFPNVQSMTQQLIKAAAAFQNTSVTATASGHYASGAVGASSFGIITQVAGSENESWGGQSQTGTVGQILNGIVAGAVKALGKSSSNLGAVATGIAQGFAATYLETTFNGSQNFVTVTKFLQDNFDNNAILAAFTSAGVSNSTLVNTITGNISAGIHQAFNAFNKTTGVWNIDPTVSNSFPMAGQYGINLGVTNTTALFNGVGTPVTDTVGIQ
jgi:hypothetical protein